MDGMIRDNAPRSTPICEFGVCAVELAVTTGAVAGRYSNVERYGKTVIDAKSTDAVPGEMESR